MRPPELRKSLGQHHLRRGEACGPAVRFLDPVQRRVIEIGPGGGVLTDQLLAAGARVLAVEIDLAWALFLRHQRRERDLLVAVGDALELTYGHLGACLVAGNLPYGISTVLVERFVDTAAVGSRAAFLVQKEVAERIVARPGEAGYGSFAVIVQLRARATQLGVLKPGSFRPPPRVLSAFVGLECRRVADVDAWSMCKHTVRSAFAQRRKTLANNLAREWGREAGAALLEHAGLDGALRAEQLPPVAFADLHASRVELKL